MCACVRAYHLLSLPFLSLIAHGPLHAAQARRDNTLTLAAAFQLLARLDRLVPLRAKQTLHPVAALVRHLPPRCIWRPIVCLRDGAGVGPTPLHDNCGGETCLARRLRRLFRASGPCTYNTVTIPPSVRPMWRRK